MNSNFRLMMRLWWVQKRRDFSWKTAFVGVYFTVLYIILVVSLFFGLREQFSTMKIPFPILTAVPLLAASIVPGDLMMKLFFRRSPVEMDDSLRSRPVAQRDWALFVLFDTAVGFLQWVLPLAVSFVAALWLPLPAALLLLVLAYSCTMLNAMFQNCWRRAPGNEFTLPLLFGYLVWFFIIYVITIATLVIFGLAADDASTPLRPGVVGVGTGAAAVLLLAVNVFAGWLLHRYFCRMKNYNENKDNVAHAHTPGQVSLQRMEWTGVWRSKRLRTSLLTIAIIFLFNTYVQQSETIIADMGFNTMLLLGVAFPSIILAQYGLGVEANYFHGIWSKPWPVEQILRNKFRFHCLICCAMAVCCLPAVLWMNMSLWTLLATLLFSMGVFLLSMIPMCLFCSRFDLFATAFFNYQGANKQMNVYSFIMFVPLGIYYASVALLPVWVANTILASLGALGLLLHRIFINRIYRIWLKRRYELMERWTKE